MQSTDISIETEGANLYLKAPYHAAAIRSYRQIDGRWDPARKVWKFAARDLDQVRSVLHEHFGYDDQPVEVVDVEVDCAEVLGGRTQRWYFGGRKIAWRSARDADVSLGKGVLLRKGEFSGSGGSVKYPLIGKDDVILEVRGVPANHIDVKQEGVTVLEPVEQSESERKALEAERAQILARLAEINAVLGE